MKEKKRNITDLYTDAHYSSVCVWGGGTLSLWVITGKAVTVINMESDWKAIIVGQTSEERQARCLYVMDMQ